MQSSSSPRTQAPLGPAQPLGHNAEEYDISSDFEESLALLRPPPLLPQSPPSAPLPQSPPPPSPPQYSPQLSPSLLLSQYQSDRNTLTPADSGLHLRSSAGSAAPSAHTPRSRLHPLETAIWRSQPLSGNQVSSLPAPWQGLLKQGLLDIDEMKKLHARLDIDCILGCRTKFSSWRGAAEHVKNCAQKKKMLFTCYYSEPCAHPDDIQTQSDLKHDTFLHRSRGHGLLCACGLSSPTPLHVALHLFAKDTRDWSHDIATGTSEPLTSFVRRIGVSLIW